MLHDDGVVLTVGAVLALVAATQVLNPRGSSNNHYSRAMRIQSDPDRALRINRILSAGDPGDMSWCEIEDELWSLKPRSLKAMEEKIFGRS